MFGDRRSHQQSAFVVKVIVLAALLTVSGAYAANDKTQANSYDNAWETPWVTHCRTIYTTTGKTAGFVLQLGDSITHSSPYGQWPRYGSGKSAEDTTLCTWIKSTVWGTGTADTTSKNGNYLAQADTSGNRGMNASSGLSADEFISGNNNGGTAMPSTTVHATALTYVADGASYTANLQVDTVIAAFNDAQFAVLMLGTNDVSAGRTAVAFIADLTTIVNKLEAANIVAVLSTIPPHYANNVLAQSYNTQIRSFAQSRGLPLIDFYAEVIARHPSDWNGTLLTLNDVHPTASSGSYSSSSDPYSPGGNAATHTTGDAANGVGYLLRSWLTVQKLKEVKSYVVDGVDPAQVLTTITVSPNGASVAVNGTQTFTAVGYDQSSNPMSPQPTFGWTISGGQNINAASGLFTAGASAGGPYTVTATSGAVTGTATVSVVASSGPTIVGDPQLKTDHAWYPGELSCSTFSRLFATQAAQYNRETGRTANNDEDKAIASWYWRLCNYYHAQSPEEYIFSDTVTDASCVRDYWAGLFSYGFALCGTTHAQYTTEMEYLLGHGKGRVVGVNGHNSHEAYLTGGFYGTGQWVLLDQDEAGIVFHDQVTPDYLMGIKDIVYSTYNTNPALRTMRSAAVRETDLDNDSAPNVNRGWYISSTYFPNANTDATGSDLYGTLADLNTLEPYSGYAGVPPMVSLKRGETLRRYLKPGLGGTTYVFWSQYGFGGSAGPECARTWCNQAAGLYRATADAPYNATQAEYGNGVYTYTPSFSDNSYKDGVISEDAGQVTFYFYSPYAIGAQPPTGDTSAWAVKNAGCSQGLVLTASAASVGVQVSTNNGTSWSVAQTLNSSLDLTDLVKGHHSYMLRFNAGPSTLAGKSITMKTVTMINDRLIPHLKDNGSTVTYQASGKAVFAAGPNRDQAEKYLTGSTTFDSGSTVTMAVPAPGGAKILEIYAAAWVASGSPPNPATKYQIEYSTNSGGSWSYIIQDWKVDLLGYQSNDYWSQSFNYGNKDISAANATTVMVRFSNDGGRTYRKADVYLVYQTPNDQTVDVTFNWTDTSPKSATHTYAAGTGTDSSWTVATGANTVTNWVEMRVNPPSGQAPAITTQPANQSVAVGSTATFTVVATGTPTLTYQWYKNNVLIGGATSASYTTPATVLGDNGATFKVVITNGSGSITSNDATLTVGQPPAITTQPANQTVAVGNTATFTVVATGTATLTYQWRKNGTNISGATSASYTTPATVLADNGALFSVAITNAFGVVTSNNATLTVGSPPVITTQPVKKSVVVGSTATFTVVATGTATLTYQWRKNGTNIGGATSASYTTPATVLADNGALFSVVITNAFGTATSNNALLTVTSAGVRPSILTQPASITVNAGSTATFTVDWDGTDPLTYQWRKNGVNITGATSFSYTTPATVLADSGSLFSVVITNGFGTVTSADATLTVNSVPVIGSPVAASPTSVVVGQAVKFSGSASDPDGDPLIFSWDFGDGATATGASAFHIYTAAGVYTITLKIDDGRGGVVIQTVQVTVSDATGGGGGGGASVGFDSDGDGVSDVQELLDGTDPFDPNSVNKLPLTISKVMGSVKFSTSGQDSCSLSGIIPNLPAGFDPTGKAVVLNIGGAKVEFTLDAKARGRSGQGTLSLTLKPSVRNKTTRKVNFLGGNVTFKAKVSHGNFAPLWLDEGMDPAATKTNASLSMVFDLKLGNTLYGAPATVTYSSKAGKSGKFKK